MQNQIEVGLAGALPGTAEIFDLFDGSHGADQQQQEMSPVQAAMMQAQNAHMMQEVQGQVAQGAAQNMHTIQELQGNLQAQQADIMHSLQQSAMPIDQAFGVEYGHMDHGFE